MTRALFTRTFWLDAIERATKSAAQGALLAVGQDVNLIQQAGKAVGVDVNLFAADWRTVIGAAVGMAALSILTSVASAPAPGLSPASFAPPGA
jgi:xanthine/uracil/vitamin C permease (AzgA family)